MNIQISIFVPIAFTSHIKERKAPACFAMARLL